MLDDSTKIVSHPWIFAYYWWNLIWSCVILITRWATCDLKTGVFLYSVLESTEQEAGRNTDCPSIAEQTQGKTPHEADIQQCPSPCILVLHSISHTFMTAKVRAIEILIKIIFIAIINHWHKITRRYRVKEDKKWWKIVWIKFIITWWERQTF